MNYLLKTFLFCFLFHAFSFAVSAQFFTPKTYPQKYFIYPVKNVRISLAANFGELRPNHYHMGLDSRTDQAENKTVVAAASGYVARISVAPSGFGQAIYINHPNGLTTVYGHLNKFFPELESYVKQQQYKEESWVIDLKLAPDQFPVKQGQFIALSGNTGGSAGPHLHFEIRDTRTDKVLNPLLFGLPVPDNVPPTIVHLYMYDRRRSTYSQSPVSIPIKKSGNRYVSLQSVVTLHTDKVSFGVTANDKQSGSANPNGIYQGILFVDNKAQCGFQLDSISYDETRYLNAHIDYKTRASGGPYIEYLTRLPGYPQGVYKDFLNDGVIELKDTGVHPVKISISDADGNTSVIEFNIQKGNVTPIPAGIPEAGTQEFYPGQVNIFESNGVGGYLPSDALYDSVFFRKPSPSLSQSPAAVSPVYAILSPIVPIQSYLAIRLKADRPIVDDSKVLIKRFWKDQSEVMPATKERDWYTARFRNFGNFELLVDNEPPVIPQVFANGTNLSGRSSIAITPTDNNGVIKNFRAELDGKWLMFTNDKGRTFVYRFDEHCGPGKHDLKISVEDAVGNRTEKVFTFTR